MTHPKPPPKPKVKPKAWKGWAVFDNTGWPLPHTYAFLRKNAIWNLEELYGGELWPELVEKFGYTVRKVTVTPQEGE